MKTIHGLLAATLFFLVACQNNNSETSQQQVQQQTTDSVQLTDFPASVAFEDAHLKGFTYQNGKFTFDYDSTRSYQLGKQTSDAGSKMCANSGQGQHLHFIINDEPYKAFYTPSFDNPMADGEYHLLAFLSRSYHESIKTDKSFLAKKVMFKGGKLANTTDISEPMLFYSRPKGTYTGEAETKKVMLDFFLVNATLGDSYRVKVEVNGVEIATLSEWKPYYLENLPMGQNTVTLTLIDADGNTINAPHNPVTRSFDLMEVAPAN